MCLEKTFDKKSKITVPEMIQNETISGPVTSGGYRGIMVPLHDTNTSSKVTVDQSKINDYPNMLVRNLCVTFFHYAFKVKTLKCGLETLHLKNYRLIIFFTYVIFIADIQTPIIFAW